MGLNADDSGKSHGSLYKKSALLYLMLEVLRGHTGRNPDDSIQEILGGRICVTHGRRLQVCARVVIVQELVSGILGEA